MHILILSHNEFISLCAVNLLASKIADHKLTFAISDQVKVPDDLDPRLAELKEFDRLQLKHVSEFTHPLIPEQPFLSYEQLAKSHKSELSVLDHPHQMESLKWLEALQPDLIISIRYQRILREEFINTANCPIINLHSGLLPQYRGVMPTFRAMIAGEKTIGTSLHLIDNSSIDTGDLIATSKTPVDYRLSYYQNTLNLYPSASEIIYQQILFFNEKREFNSKLQNGTTRYYSFPDTKSLDQLVQQGLMLF